MLKAISVTSPYTRSSAVRGFSWTGRQATTRARTQFRQGTVAFGPQHPAAHGILKLQMQLHGEVLRWIDPQFGYLHRGSEKLMEGRNLLQALPYFDRFDYVANLFQEHAYCLAIEALYSAPTPLSTGVQLARVLFDEISRLLNHLLTLSATALDLSVMGPIFWAFEEREALMELCEQASGARMHTALYRPFSFEFSALSAVFVRELGQFLSRCGRSLAGAFLGLLNNRSLKSRLSFVGQVGLAKVSSYGITGLIARSCGGLYDLRVQSRRGYTAYRGLAFRLFIGRRGDNLDRFLLRIKEVAEGFRLLSQCMQALQPTSSPSLQAAGRPSQPRAVVVGRLNRSS
jgi:NADH-quinone oxidoreductase subunit D